VHIHTAAAQSLHGSQIALTGGGRIVVQSFIYEDLHLNPNPANSNMMWILAGL
jgi:hypothetical protein